MSYLIGGGTVLTVLVVAIIGFALYKCRPRCDNCHHNLIFRGTCRWCGTTYPIGLQNKKKCKKVDATEAKAA